METLITGIILFFGTHSVSIFCHSWRQKIVDKLGYKIWQGVYSVVAFAGLVLIVNGYASARLEPVVIYTSPNWLHHISMLFLIPVFPLILATYLPGKIQSTVKHPMLVATKLWAFTHLLINGSLSDIVLFGSFLAWAVADRISLKYRPALAVNMASRNRYNDIIAIVGGLVIYTVIILWAHAWITGVPLFN